MKLRNEYGEIIVLRWFKYYHNLREWGYSRPRALLYLFRYKKDN